MLWALVLGQRPAEVPAAETFFYWERKEVVLLWALVLGQRPAEVPAAETFFYWERKRSFCFGQWSSPGAVEVRAAETFFYWERKEIVLLWALVLAKNINLVS